MPKFKVHFESSCAVGVEIAVEAEHALSAETMAKEIWRNKGVANAIANLIEVDDQARIGFAETLGVNIPYITVSLDGKNGFEVVDIHRYEPADHAKDLEAVLRALLDTAFCSGCHAGKKEAVASARKLLAEIDGGA